MKNTVQKILRANITVSGKVGVANMSRLKLLKEIKKMNLRNAQLACAMDKKVKTVVKNTTRVKDMLDLYTQTSDSVHKNVDFLVNSVRGK